MNPHPAPLGSVLKGPETLVQVLEQVPRCRALRELLLQVLDKFLDKRVAVLRRRQFCYNGQGVRHDGNYGFAKRIKCVASASWRNQNCRLSFLRRRWELA